MTEGPPAAAISALRVSWPVSASLAKTAILSSSCRHTYRAFGISTLPGLRSQAIVFAASYSNASGTKTAASSPGKPLLAAAVLRSLRDPPLRFATLPIRHIDQAGNAADQGILIAGQKTVGI